MIGELLGPYRIESELGAGGMGTVYLATVEGRAPGIEKGSKVALKVVHQHLLATPGFFKRFLREAEIGKSVRHGNVVRTLDVDATLHGEKQLNYIVMEYVEGQTLRDLLKELSVVPEQLCRHIAREVASALAAVHAAGVVHRDLKPENILIASGEATGDHDVAERRSRDGNVQRAAADVVKLMDLGVARLQDEVIRLSQTGAFVGSVMYAAPEQFAGGGESVDGRADLYALGLTLYELSTARHPFHDDDLRVAIRRQLNEKPKSPATFNPQLSPFFEEVVNNLLSKERGDRFASASAFIEILDQAEESEWWQERARAIREETHQPLRRILMPRETEVHGRGEEMARMRAAYDKAKAGEGQTVVLSGEAGIGKTRLVDAFVEQLRKDGEDPHFLFGAYPPGGAATAAGAFSTAYREHFGSEGLEEQLNEYLDHTSVLTPAFAALLRGESTPEGSIGLNKESIQTVFIQLTRGLSEEKPTIVLIDDLHFCPQEGLALFAALTLALSRHRVMLVGTARRGLPEEWVANVERLDNTHWITLQRLGAGDLAGLLIDAFGSESLAEELGFKIAHKSDGNPFFVFEILRGLREGHHLKQLPDGTWTRTGEIRDLDIPSSVLDLIEARISDLEEEDRELLDVAACCGFEFDPLLVAETLGLGRIPMLRRLGRLEKGHRLVRSAGLRWVFDHHQVQEAVYEGISELLRREYHSALGDALERREGAKDRAPEELDGALAVDLCEHFLKGTEQKRAAPYAAAALEHLNDGYLNAAVADLADRVLSIPGLLTGAERFATLSTRVTALQFLGRREQQRAAIDDAIELADELGDLVLRSRARFHKVWYLFAVGEFDAARIVSEEHLELALRSGNEGIQCSAWNSRGGVHYYLGEYEEARHAWAEMERFGEIRGRFGGNLGLALTRLGRLAEARDDIETAIAAAVPVGSPAGVGRVNLGSILASLGEFPRAIETLEESRRILRQIGERRPEGYALHRLGNVLHRSGDAEGARRRYEDALALRREIRYRSGIAETLIRLAGLDIEEGRPEEASGRLSEASEIASAANVPGAIVLAAVYRTRLPGGDAAQALKFLDEYGDRVEHELRMESRYLLWKATGDVAHLAEAHRLLMEARDNSPEQYRDSMLENVPLNRAIVAAWKEHGDG